MNTLHVIMTLSMPLFVFSLRTGLPLPFDPCNRRPVDPQTLKPDQMTVLINGYSVHRIPLLHSIATTYAASSSVAAVIILWGNPSTPPQILSNLSHNLTVSSTTPITVLRQPSASLNLRFYPHNSITTRAVVICDDDIEPDTDSINFAFNSQKYSIVLTKFLILALNYLHIYTCKMDYAQLKVHVDEMNNCEDILMNFVVAEERVRDWGDARNEGEGREERDVGLSSRKSEHRKRRGECISEFHRLLGKMPLRYSYGKVMDAIREQGLCEKAGKLVYCDKQILS
ncbi:unnamed protein product [Withania somnifera]